MINWELFWQALGAVGTILAVVVALWQSGYYNQTRLKLHARIDEIAVGEKYVMGDFVIITITNIGKYDITLRVLGIKGKKDTNIEFLEFNSSGIEPLSFPYKLHIGEGIEVVLDKSKIPLDLLDLSSDDRIRFYVEDTAKKRYNVSMKENVAQFLNTNPFQDAINQMGCSEVDCDSENIIGKEMTLK